MNIYFLTLSFGLGGLLLLALLGLSHGHAARGQGYGHGHSHLRGPALPKFKAVRPAHSSHSPSTTGGHDYTYLLVLFSPRVCFGLLFGFGAVGVLMRPWLDAQPVTLLIVAAGGSWVFEHSLVQPVWNFLLNFASEPAQTLDGLVSMHGQAATDFDRDGHGLVAVDLDGQTRQILGTLCAEERQQAPRVRTGERLCIRAVDGARNTCTVSRLSC